MTHAYRILTLFAACAAAPAMAQAPDGAGISHIDASGATAGRQPHRAMRPLAARPGCKTVYLPAGKLPTYGQPQLQPECREGKNATGD